MKIATELMSLFPTLLATALAMSSTQLLGGIGALLLLRRRRELAGIARGKIAPQIDSPHGIRSFHFS